jgi:hypothetical protein
MRRLRHGQCLAKHDAYDWSSKKTVSPLTVVRNCPLPIYAGAIVRSSGAVITRTTVEPLAVFRQSRISLQCVHRSIDEARRMKESGS